MTIKYSIILPLLNEQEVLPLLLERLSQLMAMLDGRCEIIFVDDGSTDDGPALIVSSAMNDERIRLIRLSRNFGHQIAVTAGLDAAKGEAVVIMDSDLQDPPEIVLEMVNLWRAGFDIVHARRQRRDGETRFKKLTASLFYWMLRRLSSIEIMHDVGDFRLIDQKVVKAIRLMPERDRFLRGMFSWVGFRQTFVSFDRPARHAGQTKYPLWKMVRLAVDGMVGFSDAPLRLALWLGSLVSLAAISYGLYIFVTALLTDTLIEGWASTIVILSFLSGINLLMAGVIGLYVGRIFNEAKQRPLYLVAETFGFADDAIGKGAGDR